MIMVIPIEVTLLGMNNDVRLLQLEDPPRNFFPVSTMMIIMMIMLKDDDADTNEGNRT